VVSEGEEQSPGSVRRPVWLRPTTGLPVASVQASLIEERRGRVYGLVVRFELLDGHETAFDALASKTLESIEAAEPSTAVYLIHRLPETPGVRVFYELYDDIDAFEAHERAPHVQRFLVERGQHLRADPEVWVVEPTAGLVRGRQVSGVEPS